MSTVVVVVVTRHRRDLLAKSLAVVAAQTRPPDHLVVVDNGPDDPAQEIVADCPLPSTYLPSLRNLGGAGGSRWASCTPWRSARTGCGWPTTTDALPTSGCSRPSWRRPGAGTSG